jgi:hypothetical protein
LASSLRGDAGYETASAFGFLYLEKSNTAYGWGFGDSFLVEFWKLRKWIWYRGFETEGSLEAGGLNDLRYFRRLLQYLGR